MRERACEAGPVAGRVLTSCPAFTGVNKLFDVYLTWLCQKIKICKFYLCYAGDTRGFPLWPFGYFAARQSTSPAGASPGNYRKNIYKVCTGLRKDIFYSIIL